LVVLGLFVATVLQSSFHHLDFAAFFSRQQLIVLLPYGGLLLLLLTPFSKVRSQVGWRSLLVAMGFLSVWWFVPVAYHSIVWPQLQVLKPPGEGVAPKIFISHSYAELAEVSVIFGFLILQIVAIRHQRRTSALRSARLS
jgi:hypothetical protein